MVFRCYAKVKILRPAWSEAAIKSELNSMVFLICYFQGKNTDGENLSVNKLLTSHESLGSSLSLQSQESNDSAEQTVDGDVPDAAFTL